MLVFKTSAFNRSATPPRRGLTMLMGCRARWRGRACSRAREPLDCLLTPGQVAEWLKALAC